MDMLTLTPANHLQKVSRRRDDKVISSAKWEAIGGTTVAPRTGSGFSCLGDADSENKSSFAHTSSVLPFFYLNTSVAISDLIRKSNFQAFNSLTRF
jgi:hypothetical protein